MYVVDAVKLVCCINQVSAPPHSSSMRQCCTKRNTAPTDINATTCPWSVIWLMTLLVPQLWTMSSTRASLTHQALVDHVKQGPILQCCGHPLLVIQLLIHCCFSGV
eukprot:GHRR01018576.1.p1 GENE.GHRR01018576.1~~GHRR01018576.1.p1  ORF type:complete len:106 (-),score=21.37 GHRR01018576.1:542-859(-)